MVFLILSAFIFCVVTITMHSMVIWFFCLYLFWFFYLKPIFKILLKLELEISEDIILMNVSHNIKTFMKCVLVVFKRYIFWFENLVSNMVLQPSSITKLHLIWDESSTIATLFQFFNFISAHNCAKVFLLKAYIAIHNFDITNIPWY